MYEWRVQIVDEPQYRELAGARLHIFRRCHEGVEALVVGDPTWTRFAPAGEGVAEAGIVLPYSAVRPLAIEARRFGGELRDSEVEAGVLREWLASERGRLDRLVFGGEGS